MQGFDPQLTRTLLGAVQHFDRELLAALQRLKDTSTALEQAQAQAKPHVIHVTDVTAHAACQARGCPQCAHSGVVAASSGAPFRSSPQALSAGQALAMLREQQQQQARARALLQELAGVFTSVGAGLQLAHAHALELAALLRKLSQ